MTKHGGKRAGAGAPRIDPQLKKIAVGYKLPRWMVEWMREQDEAASILIENALIEKHGLKEPVEGKND